MASRELCFNLYTGVDMLVLTMEGARLVTANSTTDQFLNILHISLKAGYVGMKF